MAVFLGSQVEDHGIILVELLVNFFSPEFIKALILKGRQGALHFQAVGHDPVKGAKAAVKTGQNAQVLIQVV